MVYVNFVIISALSNGIGVYIWGISMTKDIKNNLNAINKIAHSKRRRIKLSKRFKVTVHYHALVKKLSIKGFNLNPLFRPFLSVSKFFFIYFYRLVHKISDLAQSIFLALISWTLITICGVLLIMSTQIV